MILFALVVFITDRGRLPEYLKLFTRKRKGKEAEASSSGQGGLDFDMGDIQDILDMAEIFG